MCIGVLPAYMSVHLVYALPVEARRRTQIPRDWSYKVVVSHHGVLGIDSVSLGELAVLFSGSSRLLTIC